MDPAPPDTVKINLTPSQQYRSRRRLLATRPQLVHVPITDDIIYQAIGSGVLTAAECDISEEQVAAWRALG